MRIRFMIYGISVLLWTFEAGAYEVIVKDGDSLEIGERRIRLDGIDAPEFTQVCLDIRGNEYACGAESLHYLENLTSGKNVECSCLAQKDRYHREICECFADKVSLNAAMVAAGQAVTYRDKTYLKEEEYAKQNKLGVWQGKYMRPAIYRVLHKEEMKTKTAL